MSVDMENQLVACVFKALSSPVRVHILRLLKHGPLCVCNINEELGTEQSNISQHLNVLKSAGLVDCRKDGPKTIYSVRHNEIFDVIDAIERIILIQTEETQRSLKNAI